MSQVKVSAGRVRETCESRMESILIEREALWMMLLREENARRAYFRWFGFKPLELTDSFKLRWAKSASTTEIWRWPGFYKAGKFDRLRTLYRTASYAGADYLMLDVDDFELLMGNA